jgi:hypothetical protein
MTSLKLFYRRGAPAALLLGLIVGSPDIAQAFTPLTGTGVGLESAPTYIPPSAPYIPPPSSSGTPATQVPNLAPRTQVPPGLPLGTPVPHVVAQPPAPVKPNPGDAGGAAENGGAGIDLTHRGDAGDTGGDAY